MQPTLDFVKQLALKAGQILQSFVGKDLHIQHKSRTDLVTGADHAAEAYLIQTIRENFPDHAINAEESGELAGDVEHQWFIDPLDGTLNYAHGIPVYSVSIGYAIKNQMQLGVVYDPTRDEIFSAEYGKGAALNGQSIHVSGFTALVDCMLATGFPPDMFDTPSDNMAYFRAFRKGSRASDEWDEPPWILLTWLLGGSMGIGKQMFPGCNCRGLDRAGSWGCGDDLEW